MNFGQQVIDFYRSLDVSCDLPAGYEFIYPFDDPESSRVFELFYHQYFNDSHERVFLFGINPGRFGAGVTGISFTDPVVLQDYIGIQNTLQKRAELSSQFITDMILSYGGFESFYRHYYIAAVCPLGLLTEGKNCNYYDDPILQQSLESFIISSIQHQISMGCNASICFTIGKGKNYDYLSKLNARYSFFDKIQPLPHPRWVMQYNLRSKDKYIKQYVDTLSKEI